jgi:hypothetical protein
MNKENTEVVEFVFQFKLGDEVYLKTDEYQLKRIVTCIQLAGGSMNSKLISYELSQGDTHSDHYESEITKDLDELSRLGL